MDLEALKAAAAALSAEDKAKLAECLKASDMSGLTQKDVTAEEKKDDKPADVKAADVEEPKPEKALEVKAEAMDMAAVAELVKQYPENAADIVQMAADGKSADEIAAMLADAEKQEMAAKLAASQAEIATLKAELSKAGRTAPALTRPVSAAKPKNAEPQTEEEFNARPELVRDYLTFGAYKAFVKASAAGRIMLAK